MANLRVEVIVQLYAVAPDDEHAGDEWADEVGDAIIAAVNGSSALTRLGVVQDSTVVLDWTDEQVRA